MLKRLRIENFALISRIDLTFSAGMTALTGETGAGKSIIMEGLSAALGATIKSHWLTADAYLHAEFCLDQPSPEIQQWLDHYQLSGHPLVIERWLPRQGRSKLKVNGQTMALRGLQALRNGLVRWQSQHAHQALLKSSYQRDQLDQTLAQQQRLGQLQQQWQQHRRLQEQLEELYRSYQSRLDEQQQKDQQIHELQQMALQPDEWQQLCLQQKRLHSRHDFLQQADQLQQQWQGEGGMLAQLLHSQRQLARLLPQEERLQPVDSLLESALIQLQEGAETLHYLILDRQDPEWNLEDIEQRMGQLFQLARKFNVEPQQLNELLADLQSHQDQTQAQAQQIEQLQNQQAENQQTLHQLADQISHHRYHQSLALSQHINQLLPTLGMVNSRLRIDVAKTVLSAQGQDQVSFMLQSGQNQPFRPLAHIASGGELSRLALALQVYHRQYDPPLVQVFDEADTGLGGEVAGAVGQLMSQLAQQGQVLCISHLPQVAAQAAQQIRIDKQLNNQQVVISAETLNKEQRLTEIGRMLGGSSSQANRDYAQELLSY